ncbi:MAG: nicotinamide riboside transporter PnuC [Myxococcota bacterium]|nr:nicotinamide riboside transporter PnuC [Myxococcota bacterium]
MQAVAIIVAWLDAPAFWIAGVPCSWAEALGAVTGVACVWLLARQNVWTWPVGLANNVFWLLLFFRARLYADSALQVVFFGLGVYGWWCWVRPRRASHPALAVRRARPRERWLGPLVVALATAPIALGLARATDSPAPLADAAVLTMSIAATWGQAQKILESWWIWIAVDVISVPLYVSRGLHPTALVYAGFGALCVLGLRRWSADLAAQRAHAAAASAEARAEAA